MSEPRTEAGRRLLERESLNSRSFGLIRPEDILAIEAEARALPEDRDGLWFVDKAKEWFEAGRLTASEYGAICAVAFVSDVAPDEAQELYQALAAEHGLGADHGA